MEKKVSMFQSIATNANFIGVWLLFGLIYISNVHKAEKKLHKINSIQKEINDVRRSYINLKDKTLYQGTQYEIAKNLEEMNKKAKVSIPKKIKKS